MFSYYLNDTIKSDVVKFCIDAVLIGAVENEIHRDDNPE